MTEPLVRLYEDVTRETHPLEVEHDPNMVCRKGCASCCVDDLTVFEVEADFIQRHAASVLEQVPHPSGACAFLDEHLSCRIYSWRPYVCRTQGLPLRWLDEEEMELVEYRDVCPLNEEAGLDPTNLDEDSCWTIGPIEGRLAQLQKQFGKGEMKRVALRKLFTSHN